jgi:hypothetical protein
MRAGTYLENLHLFVYIMFLCYAQNPTLPLGYPAFFNGQRQVEIAVETAASGGLRQPARDGVSVLLVGRAPFLLVAVAENRGIKKSPSGQFLEVVDANEKIKPAHARDFRRLCARGALCAARASRMRSSRTDAGSSLGSCA